MKQKQVLVYNDIQQRSGISRYGFLFLMVILLCLASCSSLKHNYLGVARRQASASAFLPDYIAKLDSGRKLLDIETDSLLKSIEVKKNKNIHLSPLEVNLLNSNFGEQLEYDRIFNSMLQSGKFRRKFLTTMQRYSGARLLQSSELYEKSYQQIKVVRRTLNRGDIGNQIPRNVLQKARKFLYSHVVRRKLLYRRKGSIPDAADSILKQLSQTNFWKETYYSIYRNNDRINSIGYNLFSFAGNTFFSNIGKRITNRRKQKAFALQLLSVIQPYDILLSRSPGHLTSAVIPGYFGHAAIWLGNDMPKKKRFLDRLKNENRTRYKLHQKGIVEALRNGVQVSNTIEFADAEEYIILRPVSLTTDQKEQIVENTIKQMHKGYDFNFDIESSDKVNCTELVFLAYDFIDWKVRNYMDRYTLFPDDLLKTALNNDDFEIPALLRKGEMILNPKTEDIRLLIK